MCDCVLLQFLCYSFYWISCTDDFVSITMLALHSTHYLLLQYLLKIYGTQTEYTFTPNISQYIKMKRNKSLYLSTCYAFWFCVIRSFPHLTLNTFPCLHFLNIDTSLKTLALLPHSGCTLHFKCLLSHFEICYGFICFISLLLPPSNKNKCQTRQCCME
jgi:hypothetical protein